MDIPPSVTFYSVNLFQSCNFQLAGFSDAKCVKSWSRDQKSRAPPAGQNIINSKGEIKYLLMQTVTFLGIAELWGIYSTPPVVQGITVHLWLQGAKSISTHPILQSCTLTSPCSLFHQCFSSCIPSDVIKVPTEGPDFGLFLINWLKFSGCQPSCLLVFLLIT